MDADNCDFGRRAKEERAAAGSTSFPLVACVPLELSSPPEEFGIVAEGGPTIPFGRKSYDELGKFGVEERILFDFRDYGLD